MKGIIIVSAILLCAWLDPYRDRMNEGNTLYRDGKYTQADEAYTNAGEYMPSEKERSYVAFNRGDARYKAEDYDGAVEYFKQALETDDSTLQKRAFYNLGNAYYQTDRKEKALESWMNALAIDPQYTKAQMNIEKLFQEEEQKKREQQQKNQEKKQQNKEKGNGESSEEKNGEQNESDEKHGDSGERQQDAEGARNGDHQLGEKIERKLSKEQIDNILKQFKTRPLQRKRDGEESGTGQAREENW